MENARWKSWWASLGIGSGEVPTPVEDGDLGDMGTAFGLDASFGRQSGGDAGDEPTRLEAPAPRNAG